MALATAAQLVGRHDENEPGVVLGVIHVHYRIGRVHAIVQPEEFRVAKCGLDRDAGGPYALRRAARVVDMRSLPCALATI